MRFATEGVIALILSAMTPAGSIQWLIVCQLFPGMFQPNTAANMAPAPIAVQSLQAAYTDLCPQGCGQVGIYANHTVQNAAAMSAAGPLGAQSMIIYNPDFMGYIWQTYGQPAAFGIVAHELGHHINAITVPPWMNQGWNGELRADAWAGCALAKRAMSTQEISLALQAIAQYPSPSHPGWPQRILAVQHGYVSCGGQGQIG